MGESNQKLVKTSCPICGGQVRMYITEMPNEDKRQIEEKYNESSAYYIMYKGVKWVFQESVAMLASCYGLPYGLGKDAAKAFTGISDSLIKGRRSEAIDVLNQMSDTISLIEIRCAGCDYLMNRYYTK